MATYDYPIVSGCTTGLASKHQHNKSISEINAAVKENIPKNAVLSDVEISLKARWSATFSSANTPVYFYFCTADSENSGDQLKEDTLYEEYRTIPCPITSYVDKTYPFAINTSYPRLSVYYDSEGKLRRYYCDEFKIVYTYSIPVYTITVTSNISQGGTVSGGGSYENQSTATLTATANTGYKFVKWNDGDTSSSRTVTVTGNATYTATFEKLKYTVNFKNQDGSVVKTNANVEHGSTLGTLPTVSRSGYTFAGWMPCEPAKKIDGTVLDSYRYPGDKNSNIPAAYPLDKQYKNYTDKLSVHIEAYMSNWTDIKNRQIISCTEEGGWGFGYQANSKVDGAESHGFEVHTGSGYTGYDLKFGTSGVYSDNEWHSFDIVFSNGVIEIFVDGVSKGRRTASGTTIYHKYADNTIFVGAEAAKDATTPNGNYFKGFISNVFIANKGTRLVAATESTVVEGNTDYYPVWRLIPTYTATFKNHDGTVLQTTSVENGTTPSYTGATPTKSSTAQYTYTFSGWSPTVSAITGNTTYTAQFTERVRQYTVTASGENGTATGDIGTYDYWTSITLTATPNPGYEFIEWIVNGEPNSLYQNPLFTVVNQNLNIVAVFRRNGIYAGTSRAKAIYVGTTPVKAIYVGTTKVYEQ